MYKKSTQYNNNMYNSIKITLILQQNQDLKE